MSIPIIWPDDIKEQNENTQVKVLNDAQTETETETLPVPDEKPTHNAEIQETGLFDKPIEFDFPQQQQSETKKKRKFCGREIQKDGEIKKCKESTESCPFHICEECKNSDLTTDECPHKLSHNFDRKPPRLDKTTGAEHLYNLQFSCYLTMETLLARTDAKYRVDGLTQKLEEKRDAYKVCLEEIYDEYGSEIDTVVSPIMTWAMLTTVDIGTSVYENQKKIE